jgi:large subunit ribosomal protein L21
MTTYAIIHDRGKHYGVREGEVVLIDLLAGAEPGQSISFKEVALVRSGSGCKVGRPHVAGAAVTGEVEGTEKGEKTYAFKFKRRKNYHRKVGHRAKFTAVKVKSIQG